MDHQLYVCALTAAVGAVLLIIFSHLFTSSRKSQKILRAGELRSIRDLPGPPGIPVLGSLPEMARKGYHVCHLEWLRAYGTFFKYSMGPITVVVVADPATVREVAITQFKVFHDRPIPPTATATTDRGLLFATGSYWASLRATLNSNFHNESQVALLHPYLLKCCSAMLHKLEQLQLTTPPGRPFEADILPMLEEAALDAIGMSCFGEEQWHKELTLPGEEGPRKAAALYSDLERLSGSLGAITQLLLLLCPAPARPLLRRALCLVPGVPIRRSMLMRTALVKAWEERLAFWKATPHETAEEESTMKPPHNLVSSLMRAQLKGTQSHLTDSDMTAVLFNLIGAGSGTTATTVACALHYLASNPQAQERAAQEVARVTDHHGVTTSAINEHEVPPPEALSRMHYLDAVVKEALRLCPPGALLARTSLEQTVLGGCFIPEGTPVLAPIYAMHRYEGFFTRPDEFIPERFLENWSQDSGVSTGAVDEASTARGKESVEAFMPFGLGPRKCLGQKYALMECKMFLAAILLRYALSLRKGDMDLKLVAGINLKPQYGVVLHFHERT